MLWQLAAKATDIAAVCGHVGDPHCWLLAFILAPCGMVLCRLLFLYAWDARVGFLPCLPFLALPHTFSVIGVCHPFFAPSFRCCSD